MATKNNVKPEKLKLVIDDDLWIAMMINSSLERFDNIQSLRSAGSYLYDKVFIIIAGLQHKNALYKLRFMHELYPREKSVLLDALRYAIDKYVGNSSCIMDYLLIRISILDRKAYTYIRGVYMTHRQSDSAMLPLSKTIVNLIASYKIPRLAALPRGHASSC